MSRIFETEDATGRKIYLTKERLAHILKHPEMANQLKQIEDVLVHPDKITTTDYDADVRFYYRYYKERREFLFISVKYLNGEGFIITSYYTDRIQ